MENGRMDKNMAQEKKQDILEILLNLNGKTFARLKQFLMENRKKGKYGMGKNMIKMGMLLILL